MKPKRFWWKTYFFLILLLTAVGMGFDLFFTVPAERNGWDWLFLPMHLAQLAGLFGFAYRRPIATPRAWRAAMAVSLPHEAWSIVSLVLESGPGREVMVVMMGIAAATLFIQLPLFVALYRYAFKCEGLWLRSPPATAHGGLGSHAS